MKHTEHNAFLNEALETLNRIYKDNKHLTQLRWFLKVALQRFNKDYLNSRSPRLIVLGDDIPAEILYAVKCSISIHIPYRQSRRRVFADSLPFSASLLPPD